MKSDPPPAHDHDEADVDRGRLERIVPEIVRRLLELGYEKLSEGPENVRKAVGDLKLPKEVLSAIFAQLDESKSGLYRVVAREVRDFLERTSFAEELTRALTAVSFEIRTEVRFIPNAAGERPSPDVRSRVSVRRRDGKPVPDAAAREAAAPEVSETTTETHEGGEEPA